MQAEETVRQIRDLCFRVVMSTDGEDFEAALTELQNALADPAIQFGNLRNDANSEQAS